MSKHSTLPLFCGRLQSVKFKEEAIFQDWKTVGMMRENVIVRILKGKLYVTRIIENENYQQERWKCNSPAFIGNYKKTDTPTNQPTNRQTDMRVHGKATILMRYTWQGLSLCPGYDRRRSWSLCPGPAGPPTLPPPPPGCAFAALGQLH